jgi:hypothetical protein
MTDLERSELRVHWRKKLCCALRCYKVEIHKAGIEIRLPSPTARAVQRLSKNVWLITTEYGIYPKVRIRIHIDDVVDVQCGDEAARIMLGLIKIKQGDGTWRGICCT